MAAAGIAARPDQIDPAWMTAALAASGALKRGRVTALESRPVGNGLVGDSFRFQLTYDEGPDAGPASVIGKFPAADPASRASGSSLRLYLREVSFYREIASTVGIITPRPYYAEIDRTNDDFTLILEDLGPARPGDQLHGCSLADAQTALLEAAALHAPRWGDPALEQLDWLVGDAGSGEMIAAALPMIIAAFKDRYAGQLDDACMAVVERMAPYVARLQTDTRGPRTVQHGDFRLDNILFDIQGGTRRMGTLDWQTLALGPGMTDVAYFLSAGLEPDLRRANERELVRLYLDELQRLGVRDYGFEQGWRDYRRLAVHGILMGVFSAMAVERTERGDALFLTMTRGACLQALDHDTYALWDAD